MKPGNLNQRQPGATGGAAFLNACRACGQRVLRQIDAAKRTLFEESFKTLGRHEHLLRLVLNEAEALAWQTTYPHLVFPALATEKVQAVAAWNRHQQFVRRTSPVAALTRS